METANLKGEKISKNALEIHLLGTLDELNAHIGLVKNKLPEEKEKKFLEAVQINLMKMMSHVSDPSCKTYLFSETETGGLIKEINSLKDNHSGEFEFVLPGKNEIDAIIHIARTVARRAERCFAAVLEQTISEETQSCGLQSAGLSLHAASYLNKLSEYLFYLSL